MRIIVLIFLLFGLFLMGLPIILVGFIVGLLSRLFMAGFQWGYPALDHIFLKVLASQVHNKMSTLSNGLAQRRQPEDDQ